MAITITELYQGKVIMRFDSYWHKYTVTDEENGIKDQPAIPVTTVLKIIDKPQLLYWAVDQACLRFKENIKPGVAYDEMQLADIFNSMKKAHYEKKTEAGDAGTLLHNWIEKFIKSRLGLGDSPLMPINPNLRKSVEKFLFWVHNEEVEFLATEQPLYSRKHNFAGTLDCIVKFRGKLYIGDWKTSSGIYLTHKVQVASYRLARTEEYPKEKYNGQIIVRIGRDGTLDDPIVMEDKQEYEDMADMFLHFLQAGNTYRRMESASKEYSFAR